MARPIGTPRTTRLRKLECGCGNIAYQSRSRLQTGLLACPCGGELIPVDLDDAALVLDDARLASHPRMLRFEQLANSAIHGQSGPARSLRATGKTFRSPNEIAMERLEAEVREGARETRLRALRTRAEAASDPIPF